MTSSILYKILFFFSVTAVIAQTAGDGYTDYNLAFEGDKRGVVYETATTASNVRLNIPFYIHYITTTAQSCENDI